MARSIQLLSEAISLLLKDRNLKKNTLTTLSGVHRALTEAVKLGASLPIGKVGEDEASRNKTGTQFLEFFS